MNNHYELLYIVSLHHTGDDLNKVMANVAKLIKDNNGEITLDNIIGKQKLAYPIKKEHQGTYVVVEIDLPRENMLEIDKQLKLMPEILRHLVIVKKVKTEEDLAREKKRQERLLKEKEQELAALEGGKKVADKTKDDNEVKEAPIDLAKDEVVEEVKPKVEEVVVEPTETKEVEINNDIKEKKGKSKASLDDLDKRLDEILTDDII